MCVYNCVSVFIILRAGIEQSHDQLPQTPRPLYEELQLGLDRLCWHNFENNRYLKELGIMLE